MKSNSALNKIAPGCPLNVKLREIHDIKQAINNSHMPEDVKKVMMSTCDSQTNQAWRWHYAGKAGYEIIHQDRRTRIKRILKTNYRLNVEVSESHLYGTNEFINLMVVAPHEGNNNKWMLRVGAMATFDRWANSTSIERFFDCPEHVAVYLEEHADYIYKKVLESISQDARDMQKTIDDLESDYLDMSKKLRENNVTMENHD
jgi:cation transport regulator ChaB